MSLSLYERQRQTDRQRDSEPTMQVIIITMAYHAWTRQHKTLPGDIGNVLVVHIVSIER